MYARCRWPPRIRSTRAAVKASSARLARGITSAPSQSGGGAKWWCATTIRSVSSGRPANASRARSICHRLMRPLVIARRGAVELSATITAPSIRVTVSSSREM